MVHSHSQKSKIFRRFAATAAAGVLLLLNACQTYTPKPITRTAVNNALAVKPLDELRVEAAQLRNPMLRPSRFDPHDGLTPDEAAIISVLINPTLRAARNQRSAAAAQLLSAGILPNPQISFNEDFPFGSSSQGAVTAYGIGINWEITSLITHDAKVRAAEQNATSIDLSIAWQEWQVAQAARNAVYDLLSLQNQLEQARDVEARLSENAALLRGAVEHHQKTLLDLAAAQAASVDARSIVLSQQHDVDHQRLVLNHAMGFPPQTKVQLSSRIELPHYLKVPTAEDLTDRMERRRLDLVALRHGYLSQEETLRAAVLAQFPKINIGFNHARDNTGIKSLGFAVTLDLPLFDRNQGVIGAETATRQRLFDEYTQRVFDARSDIATALADINSINHQIEAAQQAIPSLDQLVNTYKSALDHGNADVLSYYTAVTNVAQKRIDLLKLQQQLIDNRIALELAAGTYLPDSGVNATRPSTNPSQEPSQ